MTLRSGEEAVVRATVATLWARPEAVRAIDAPALAPRTDIRQWISRMDPEQQLGECVLTQMLLGEHVLVERIRPDGWAYVIAVEQPAETLDPRGYPGWMPVEHLAPPSAVTAADEPLIVDASTTALHGRPGGDVIVPGVILGTRLLTAGPADNGWQPVRTPGYEQPLWVPREHLVPVPTTPPTADEVLAVASRLQDVPYIWGGVSTYGIDCSGLVHLAWRRFGVRLPRDAKDQAQVTTPLALGDELPGDLYFFARPGRDIHHIGFVTAPPSSGGERRMLDACSVRMRVNDLPLSAERRDTLVGVHRVA